MHNVEIIIYFGLLGLPALVCLSVRLSVRLSLCLPIHLHIDLSGFYLTLHFSYGHRTVISAVVA